MDTPPAPSPRALDPSSAPASRENGVARVQDAQAFALAIYALVHHPDDLRQILAPIAAVLGAEYASPENILSVLLVHTNPVSTPMADVLALATDICANTEGSGEPDLAAFVADLVSTYSLDDDVSPAALLLSSDAAAVEVADSLLADTKSRAHALGFVPSAPEPLVPFVQAKCLHYSRYLPEISGFFDGFTALNHSHPYISWYNGVICPYDFYCRNYKIPNDLTRPASDFLSLESHALQLSYLADPLLSHTGAVDLSVPRFLAGTAFPLAAYHNGDLSQLSAWLVQNYTRGSLADFRFWHDLLSELLSYEAFDGSRFTLDSVSVILRQYLCMCLFFGLEGPSMPSVEYSHVQDQIQTTLQFLLSELQVDHAPSGLLLGASEDLPEATTFADFSTSAHPLISAIFHSDIKQVLADLSSVVSTCCTLYSLNDLTIRKYFQLKADSSGNWLQKETLSILAKVETASYSRMAAAVDSLKKAFISDASSEQEIDKVVFERLLQLDSYENALLSIQQTTAPCAVTFPLATSRFWELLENASNLDDRIGKLKLACSCLETMAQLADTKQSQSQVIRIRHLLKALQNLKNFKLVLQKNQPVTPKHILEKLTLISSEEKFPPISLIAIILEQNPKSYLAYEKLYKIVNDLAIYLDLDLGEISFPKVQTACVESALIDCNFNFAYKHAKELLEYFVESGRTEELSDVWLMFYQVGKFISADWFNDYDEKVEKEKIGVLYRQREILSLAIKNSTPHKGTIDNSRLLVGQFRHVNSEIQKWYEDAEVHRSENVQRAVKTTQMQIQENISGILNEANNSKKQAGEKLTSLLTSGLGWAIGATDRH